ncbi:HlyD family efflux transporter periplasmic adaptor subunit [Aestuariibacter sp. GS-14]|uniref:efflux RND transporter periplasmic adaptor subunit n=1 Tax=Aestuariibacter sp. GS-14 TaxID=2590670 RepID=UPI00112D27B9|nr:HlyD family efflux transporter periplasmic adaptor subunit [Aestuariibacter sp. GS-14]TPV61730.1 HlyD family efflux transporter periplasmic adaptor subunit [Aestuariibacter sp. GS-14]
MRQLLTLAMCFGMLSACNDTEQLIPTYEVRPQPFSLAVPMKGELEAAQATAIGVPSRRPMTIAWLEQEYTQVKKGQLVARFDAEQLSLDMRQEMLAIMLLEEDMKLNRENLSTAEKEVNVDKALVVKEFAFADEFSIDDLRVYSQLEIIENMQNKEYLGAKDEYLDWKKDSVVEQNTSAIDVIAIRKQGSQAKYDQLKLAMDTLEIRAPYDGMLVYEANWRGEKPAIGETVFPGRPIAKIPDMSAMQAKGYVLDKEAIDLAPGQTVSITLDAYPDQLFTGKVKEVSGFSRTISRNNPTKYFEVTVNIDDQTSDLLTPGRKLHASIQVSQNESRLTLPTQAIYSEQGVNFVFKQTGSEFIKQRIEIGQKNLFMVEVTEGLASGDVIALAYKELL